ncbi:MAG: hypothetical protein C3F12_00370 [Candidatus Methylomirabilota bacterium]|nr:MAG: hypothetical protein C3F12_00370 [candidate division NC10 bacterium]
MKTHGQHGQVVITIDAETGKLVSVTDGKGKVAQRVEATAANPSVLGTILSASTGTVFHTQINPCSKWVYWDGNWYQVPC